MPPTKSTGTLIAEWITDDKPHRLVAVGRYSAGFEDSYVIERQEPASLGEPCWTRAAQWRPEDADPILTMLVAALKHKVNARL